MSIQCKRLLSLLLAVLLVMGLPFSAMAASIDDTSPVTEPETTEPETTPDVTEPVTTEPGATEPTSAETEPLETEPESTEPEETESVNTLSAEHQRILDELPQAIKGDDPEHPYPYGVPVDNLFPEEVQRRAMMRANMAAIPEEMYDNAILRALEYTGFDVQWLKDKAAEMVEHKIYPKVPGADGKMVDDKSKPFTIVMKPQTFMGIKKAVIMEFFTDKKQKAKTFLDEVADL